MQKDPNLTVHRYDSNWIFAGRMNMANPILQDKAVREAIAHAIDREKILTTYFRPSRGQKDHAALSGPYLAGSWAHSLDAFIT